MAKTVKLSRVAYAAALAFLIAALLAGAASAQTPTPNQINEIARELWCPLCNGVRLDNCELQACIQMREVISQKMMAGESKEAIKAYFVQQYGDVVLGQPSREGFNLVVWIFPILAGVVGAGWIAYAVVTWRKKQAAAAPSTASARGSTPDAPAGADEYAERVERELKNLD